jgi:hypothetical protein
VRSIRRLYNFEPPATQDEIDAPSGCLIARAARAISTGHLSSLGIEPSVAARWKLGMVL